MKQPLIFALIQHTQLDFWINQARMTDGRNLDMVGTTEVGNRLTDFSDISVIKNITVLLRGLTNI